MSESAAKYFIQGDKNPPSILVYDCEIIKAIPPENDADRIEGIEYCEGWRDFDNMGISVICGYDYLKNRYRVFMKDNFNELQKLMNERDILVGFNSRAFDDNLCFANGFNIAPEKSYDILIEVWLARGLGDKFDADKAHQYLGLGLDNLAQENLGRGKTGNGALAPIQWQQGKYGIVTDYCLADVELTKGLLDLILKNGKLKDCHENTKGNILKLRRVQASYYI
jgi:hypothetical protein